MIKHVSKKFEISTMLHGTLKKITIILNMTLTLHKYFLHLLVFEPALHFFMELRVVS